jgi:hypothetical protein
MRSSTHVLGGVPERARESLSSGSRRIPVGNKAASVSDRTSASEQALAKHRRWNQLLLSDTTCSECRIQAKAVGGVLCGRTVMRWMRGPSSFVRYCFRAEKRTWETDAEVRAHRCWSCGDELSLLPPLVLASIRDSITGIRVALERARVQNVFTLKQSKMRSNTTSRPSQ